MNPVDPEQGALCFRDFGWQVLEQMRAAGFSDPRALVYWSRELGYLGGDQILLVGPAGPATGSRRAGPCRSAAAACLNGIPGW